MLSDGKSRRVKALPPFAPYAKLLVADEFRTEQGGKVLAIGLYSDGVVVFTIPKNAPKPTKEAPYGIPGLALLLTVGGFEGDAIVRFGIKGSRMLEHTVSLSAGGSANIILNVRPFRVGSFGVKDVFVEVAETKLVLHFEVRANFIDAVDDLNQYISSEPELALLPAPSKGKTSKAAPKKARVRALTKSKLNA